MRARHQGFVLITVIMMLTVMTILVVENLKLVWLYLKRHQEYHRYQQLEEELEATAEGLVPSVGLRGAVMQDHNEDATRDRVLHSGWSIAKTYHYDIMDLGVFPCVKVLGYPQSKSSHQWLLTVMDERLNQRMVQLRVATPIADKVCEWEAVTYVHAGIMSWRLNRASAH